MSRSFSPEEQEPLLSAEPEGADYSSTNDEHPLSTPAMSPEGSETLVEEPRTERMTGPVPPEHLYRTLVLCFDGTGDQFDADNSNIVELFAMLKKDDREHQMCYYQAGIGTYTNPEIATPLMAKISKTLDEAIAWNLDAHVMGTSLTYPSKDLVHEAFTDGYEFLMQNYKAGDRICIFGFSRGAYTARALAGMIHKVGLLPACNHQQVPFAYKMFKTTDEIGWKQSNAFKRAFSVDVKIEFIGVWDTVNSVGLIPRRLPFTTSNTIVRTFRHAVSLDERRSKFKANHWNVPTDKEAQLGTDVAQKPTAVRPKPVKKHTLLKAMERKFAEHQDQPTDVLEVWFSGCHCDVGGGSVENGTPHSLARIPLRWMVRECFKAKTGIMFMADGLRGIGLEPASLFPVVLDRPPALQAGEARIQRIPSPAEAARQLGSPALVLKTEEEHELLDALSPIYDQLKIKWWFWWILEVLPQHQRHQAEDKTWVNKFTWNWWHGRKIPRQKKDFVYVHRSVKTRMEAKHADGTSYYPSASFQKAIKNDRLVWVD
ncbi:hypothetical protein H0H81_011499 [Sphagnurus paluster]|uniref:T6SS Phospholipase effector Tle1-like catalytic domain-containing protein n=1 Tax=Sphagnurus paluster TaxID=117069 RepID=A0A9P7K6Z5_9AGAR|nr:hypothetical protein H0H81_011499 [Sphagnurus paluster]